MEQRRLPAILEPMAHVKRRFDIIRYSFPNVLAPRVSLTPRAETWLAVLRRDGVARVEDQKLQDVADYLNRVYYTQLEQSNDLSTVTLPHPDLFVIDGNTSRYRQGGIEITVYISYKDPSIAPLFFHPEVMGVLYNYYGRQPYFRSAPILQKISYDGKRPPVTNVSWHVDYFRQVTFMLLVSDVTERDTHMQYAIGSHENIRRVGNYPEDIVARLGYPVFDLTGPRGTLFMFDGCGIHRARYIDGTIRKALFITTTTGHHIVKQHRYDKLSSWPGLASYPPYCQRLIRKLALPA